MTDKKKAQELLSLAGVEVNGKNQWDIHIHNEGFYSRVLSKGSLALGESYMDGWWDVEELDEFFDHVLRVDLNRKLITPSVIFHILRAKFFNLQNISRAFKVGEQHYDIGNDLYSRMLDKRLVYTCGYWKNAQTLESAQEAKLDLVCRKLNLQKGQRILDIGCGWGSFAKFAAERYGVEVVGITISKEQAKFAEENTKGLPVEIRLQDYRDIDEVFDHVVSLGMFEHVGYKNYREYMRVVNKSLKKDGLFLLHTIGSNYSSSTTEPWIEKYIFPGGMLPSIKQIGKSIEEYFVMEDWHNFGVDYDKTLVEWFKNFDKAWPELKEVYGERFYRMWKYYLLASAGSFRSRKNQLWQIVLSKKGIRGGYQSVR
ncbi:MAG TPA: cyclopropane fatty acyl phospholipid synthase [Candidatus Kaiserbacteria bacterium]|nr:cyclopropane fatty acyl phospholipid synthase [Candidatus Kaiserbacteria bacterium]